MLTSREQLRISLVFERKLVSSLLCVQPTSSALPNTRSQYFPEGIASLPETSLEMPVLDKKETTLRGLTLDLSLLVKFKADRSTMACLKAALNYGK